MTDQRPTLVESLAHQVGSRTFRDLTAGSGDMDEGRHYVDAIEEIKAAMREGRYADAERLLLRALGAAENESRVMRWGAPPWYYERLAVLYRRQKRFDDEIEMLERFAQQEHAPGATPPRLAERLVKARALKVKRDAV